ncbi:uncharacterized protein F4822DRAFT_432790 [Hypoxylon trugodes]|uniref:uncharacterized protein n=1 Tax=Hypoxylon trugodes TaxID=326681 RepID=UPI00219AB791|nr:uncharacterized protein F4822DRAFT_432790 [Hypoxylon trugodes]KAI1385932.1 hypothetical protein F4822DRAFT_432790 [Hypoxylon trugodes]
MSTYFLRRATSTSAISRRRLFSFINFRITQPYSTVLGTSPLATTLHYLDPLEIYKTEKPYHLNVPPSALAPHQKQSNEVSKAYEGILINDLRGRESDFTLDANGFQVFRDEKDHVSLNSALKYEDYENSPVVKDKYREAVKSFLVERLGAGIVIPFTHEVRRRSEVFPLLPRGTGKAPQPVQGVHVGECFGFNSLVAAKSLDFTPRWAAERARMVLGESLAHITLNRRWQVLNIWRPLFGPLHDWPLALCDWKSINPIHDLEPSDNVYTHLTAETYNVYHNPSHRWYYISNMEPTETFVFKSFDSDQSYKVARVCPHAAFFNANAPKGCRARESVECLVLVVYPEGKGEVGHQSNEWLP